MFRNLPQESIEIQEMTERTPVNQAASKNGSAKNGSLKRSRSAGSLKRSRSAGSLRRGKQPKRPDSGDSNNGLIDDDDSDYDDYDYDLEYTKGQRIRNILICVFIGAAVVTTVIVVAVTVSGKSPSKPLGFLLTDDVNYTDTLEISCTPLRGVIEDDIYIFLVSNPSPIRW